MTVIWSGITEGGAIVPVQVDETGRVVATQQDSGLDYWEKDGDVLTPSGGESVSVEGTVSSSVSFLGPTASFTADITIHGLIVGKGGSGLDSNTAIGQGSLEANTSGEYNTAVGQGSLLNNTEGLNNTAVGQYALTSTTTGNNNTAVGRNALLNNTESGNNTAVGQDALLNNTGGFTNTAIGQGSLLNNTSGNSNTAVGRNALESNTESHVNTAIGRNALQSSITGGNNTAVGSNALLLQTEGDSNTAVGRSSLSNLRKGSNNTFIGRNAGFDGLNDTVCISAGNTIRLWIDSLGQTGVGTNNPQATLDVAGPALFSNGLCGFLDTGEIFFQSRNLTYKLVVSSGGLVTAEELPQDLLRLEDRQEIPIPEPIETNDD